MSDNQLPPGPAASGETIAEKRARLHAAGIPTAAPSGRPAPRPAPSADPRPSARQAEPPEKGGFDLDGFFDSLDEKLPDWMPGFLNSKRLIIGFGVVLLVLVFAAIFGAISGGGQTSSLTAGLPNATVAPSATPLPGATPTPGGVFGFNVQGPPKVDVNVVVTLAGIWMLVIVAFGFAETVSRRERFALDWWAPILFVAIAVLKDQFSHDLWLILQTSSAAAVVAAIALNENRPTSSSGKGVWAQVFNLVTGTLDMTPLYQVGALLLALGYAQWAILPYPAWIDPKVAWAFLIIGGLFEVTRAPIATLLAIGLGAAAGFAFDPWITVIVTLVVMVMGMIGHQVGWLPSTGHSSQNTMNVAGREFTVAIRWDLILLASIAYFLVALTAHGNIVLYTLTRTAGG